MQLRFGARLLVIVGLLGMGLLVAAQETQERSDLSLPITEDTTYTIRNGDTLDTIGALFDVDPMCLAQTNSIERGAQLEIGQTLQIQVSCPTYGYPSDATPPQVQIPRDVVTFEDECDGYRVRQSDTLDTIAQALDVSVISLRDANDITNPRDIQPRECLTVPDDAPPYGEFPTVQTADGSAGQGGGSVPGERYTVQPGDTLDTIAQAFDVSVVSLQLDNNIENPRNLQPGTSIVIPEDAPAYGEFPAIQQPMQGMLYTVEPGDTLDSIAQDFDVARQALEAANNISPGRNALPGTVILIPDNVPAYGDDDAFEPSQLGQGGGAADIDGDPHVVQPRETLDGIAAFYNVDTSCLAESNGIENPRLLQPGTVLIIDETCPAYTGFDNRFQAGAGGGAADTSDAADTSESTEADSGEAVPITERENESNDDS